LAILKLECLATGTPKVFFFIMLNNVYAKFGAATSNVIEIIL